MKTDLAALKRLPVATLAAGAGAAIGAWQRPPRAFS